ncbi:hypothetical protein [Rhizobium sullae]|uniref:YycE-like C-terminal domain-containing protein n=1 Tax=Rhizobium sullae TaxID=50338 RepID=A0A4R3Q9D8_RHISU|nr:hypothetical protein EV132_103127 [Rhizobium sullae]
MKPDLAMLSGANPFWDHIGLTFEEHDGYRIVLQDTGSDL